MAFTIFLKLQLDNYPNFINDVNGLLHYKGHEAAKKRLTKLLSAQPLTIYLSTWFEKSLTVYYSVTWLRNC